MSFVSASAAALFVLSAAAAYAAKVETFSVHSAAMDKDVPVSAILPVGYDSSRKYPVVYLMHGAGGSHTTWIKEDVQFLCDKYGFVGISPDGGKTSWWWDSPVDPTFRYETFVIREVMPFVERKYSIDARRERRAILGGSMGGHGACWLGFRHKELFGAVGSIFGGVDVRPFPQNWDVAKRLGPLAGNEDVWKAHCAVTEAAKLANGDVELCMMIGTKDFFLQVNRDMHDLLAKNGVEHTYIEYTTESPKTSGHCQEFKTYASPVMFKFFDNYFKTGSGLLATGSRPHVGAAMVRAREQASVAECAKPQPSPAPKDEIPTMMIRLRAPETDGGQMWAGVMKIVRENRNAFDDVWLSTGINFPKLEWHAGQSARHAKAAADLRALGIGVSVQYQAEIGHGDKYSSSIEAPDVSGKTWTGFTGAAGTECRQCNCPRQKAFLDYMRETGRLYAASKPWCVWLDDDMRVNNHLPATDDFNGEFLGCFCDTCVGDFSGEEGRSFTRESLVKAIRADAAMKARWERFSFTSLAGLARAIAEGVHEVSPESRMGYEFGPWPNQNQLLVFEALYQASGRKKVLARPGGGDYYDNDPFAQVKKSFTMACQMRMLGESPFIEACCPEVECWPRTLGCRTAQGIFNESLVSLACGAEFLSLAICDLRLETPEWYSKTLFGPLARNADSLRAFARHNRGSKPAGVDWHLPPQGAKDWPAAFARTGVPLVPGLGFACARLRLDALETRGEAGVLNVKAGFDPVKMSCSEQAEIRKAADAAAGGKLPVLAENPALMAFFARTLPDGTLRSVVAINESIGLQNPVRLRLRGVAPGRSAAVWRAFDEPPVELPISRDGVDSLVTLPPVRGWNCGWIEL